jgi:hypothetical protein
MKTIFFACATSLGLALSAQAQDTPPLPAGWFLLTPGSLAQSHEGLSVFHVMYESEAALFDDLPDAQTHAQLLAALEAQCRATEMTAEIARVRATFLKMGIPENKLFDALRLSVRHDGTLPDGARLVTVFETLHDLNPDGTCGPRRSATPAVVMQDTETRIIRG